MNTSDGLIHPCGCARRAGLDRRGALALLVGGGGSMLVGCAELPAVTDISGLSASLVPPEEETKLGDAAFAKIRRETPVLRDAATTRRVATIGRRVVEASGASIPADRWDFVVFDDEQINAFALPGGHVGVYRGILSIMDDDAQLATVIGHEVGHVNARHAAQRVGTSEASNIGASVLAAALGAGDQAFADQLGGLLGVGLQYGVILPFSRGQELQADQLGLGYMARAGYDPNAALGFWRNMAEANQAGAGTPAFLSTHPSDAERIERLRAELPAAEAEYRPLRS